MIMECELADLMEAEARESLLGCCQLLHPTYTWEQFHTALCADLDQFEREVEQRLSPRYMIWVPPQHSKSTITSRTFPARLLGRHPDWPIQLSSYAVSLAAEHSRWVRNVMDSQSYKNTFPDAEVSNDSAAKDFFHTTKGGFLLATGVDGGQTGNPSRVSIIDDPFKNREEAESEVIRAKVRNWYPTSVRTRLADGGGILIFHTRWHPGDLCGWLLDEAKKNPGAEQWKVIKYPAIAEEDEAFRKAGEPLCPNLHSLKDLQSIRATIPPRDWMALYQQKPISESAGYYIDSDFRTYTSVPKRLRCFITTDLALGKKTSNDWTVFLPWGLDDAEDIYMLPSMIRRRMDPLESTYRLLMLADAIDAEEITLPDDNQGKTMRPFIDDMMGRKMNPLKVGAETLTIPRRYFTLSMLSVAGGDKQARGRPFQALQRAGKVFWPEGSTFNEIIKPEMLAFVGDDETNDIHDAASDAGRIYHRIIGPSPVKVPEHVNPDRKRWDEVSKREKKVEGGVRPLFAR